MKRLMFSVLLALASMAGGATYYVGPANTGSGTGADGSNLRACGDLSWTTQGDIVYFRSMDDNMQFLRWPSARTYYANAIYRHNLRWTFDADVRCGQFANKDPWVLATAGRTITTIYPAAMTGNGVATTTTPDGTWVVQNGRHVHGSMFPDGGSELGYDSWGVGYHYDDDLNVGQDLPISLASPFVMISSYSKQNITTSHAAWLRAAAVLTCVASVPSYTAFRPGYCDQTATVVYTTNNIDWTKIGNYHSDIPAPYPLDQTGATDAWHTSLGRMIERVLPDHYASASNRAMHAQLSMPDYGEYVATVLGGIGLYLMLDYENDAAKQTLAVEYLQIGLDLYSFISTGGIGWIPDGGHNGGRKWPILFAGIVFGNAAMQTASFDCAEDGQTFFVSEADIYTVPYSSYYSNTYGAYYQKALRDAPDYTTHHLGMPEWKIQAGATAKKWATPAWDASYRTSDTARAWFAAALAAMLLDYDTASCGRALWNHEPLFDYLDRFRAKAGADPWNSVWGNGASSTLWNWQVWDELRPTLTNYPVWGPDTYDLVAPGAPTNLRAVAGSTSLALSWDPPAPASDGDYAANYRIWVGPTRTTAPAVLSQEPNQYLVTGLAQNTSYKVWISALDDTDQESLTTLSGTFTTAAEQQAPQIANVTPANLSYALETAPTLDWTCDQQVNQLVYLDTNNPPTTLRATQAGTTYDTTSLGLSNATIYYWRIGAGETLGDTWSFSITAPTPPAPAILPIPGDGSTGAARRVRLEWTDGGGAVNYDVWLSQVGSPLVKVSDSQAGTFYLTGALTYGATYQWKITTRDVEDEVTDSATWTFTVKNSPKSVGLTGY